MSHVEQRLKDTINFLVQHLPGASELAEIAECGTIVLDSKRDGDAEKILIGKTTKSYDQSDFQRALDEFKTRNLCNLEIGRLYERYIGYLKEQDNWKVAFTGILGGYGDLGRDLVCIKDNQHQIIQAKCWSKKKEIHEKHIYQLYATVTHYRLQLRESFKLKFGRKKARQIMGSQEITGHLISTTKLSEMAKKVARHCCIHHEMIELSKAYPMVKCNISKRTGEKRYHLPFDSHYDSIIIGNVEGERYVNTVQEAESSGFKRIGYA